ncbi:MAG: NifU family protein [Bdellovibrionales bacterium]
MHEYSVFYEATPNPQSMKFVVTAPIASEAVNFTSVQEAARSPLALKIFGFPWAAGVFIGPSFVTVTKQEWVDWDILAEPLSELIKEHLNRGEPVLVEKATADSADEAGNAENPNDLPVVRRIKQILREEIRPAVAMDGGDIVFERYEEGRVYLRMQGACSGCPSSVYTLKEGIETRLREAVPEVREVFSV